MPPSAVLARFTISFSRLLPKKSRAVLKELYPLFRGHKVCRCEDDAEGAARGALKALPAAPREPYPGTGPIRQLCSRPVGSRGPFGMRCRSAAQIARLPCAGCSLFNAAGAGAFFFLAPAVLQPNFKE